MSDEISKKTLFDYTAVITIGGILLYQLGWVYWERYLNKVGIDSSFIDISFEKIISTTWTSLAIILLGFALSIEKIFKLKDKDTIYIVDGLFILIIGIITILIANSPHFFKIIGGAYILVHYFDKKMPLKWKESIGTVNHQQYFIGLFVIIFIFSSIYYYVKANNDADLLLSNFENDIEITLNNESKTIKGKFIIYMNDKYFVLIENNKCKRETLVINNSEINHTKFLTKIKYDRTNN